MRIPYLSFSTRTSPLAINRLFARISKVSPSRLASTTAEPNDPEASAKELVEIILTDPPLAANVLRLVNSAHFAPRRRIADIQQAVIFIGFDALKELALSQKVSEIFKKVVNIEGYTRQSLWRHSVAVAQFAKMVYRREFAERGANVYAAGLLHDLGIIIEDQFRNSGFFEALHMMKKKGQSLWEAERSVFGFDHGRIGAAALQKWHLPDEIVQGIAYHHSPDRAPAISRRIAATLFVANRCCQQAEIGYCDAPLENETIYDQCIDVLDIEHHAIDFIMADTKVLIAEMVEQGLL